MRYSTLLILCCAITAGCSDVQPWQRGNLAKPIMAADPYPLQTSARMHNYASREAAGAASSGASGGGCGCN
jgi:hypothetical protein